MIQSWNRKCDRNKKRGTLSLFLSTLTATIWVANETGEVILLIRSSSTKPFFLSHVSSRLKRGWRFDKLGVNSGTVIDPARAHDLEKEREREREILRDEQTTSDSAGDRRRGTIESSKTRVQAKSFCIPLLTRLLNLLRNREATYIRLG